MYKLTDLYKQIKEAEVEPEQQYKIYCDMDGVLTDFDKRFKNSNPEKLSPSQYQTKYGTDKFWRLIDGEIGVKFWVGMPWMEDGKQYWDYIKKYNPHILSAYVEHAHDPNCIPGKSYWAKTNLGIGSNRINLVKRVQKQNYAKVAGQPAVLIDDYIKNTDQFTQRGGHGIRFTSANQAIAELKKLGF